MAGAMGRGIWRLEAMDLDGLGVDFKTLVLVDEKILHSIALVALELYHVAGLFIVDDRAIAGKLFLDDLEDLLEVELGWDALDRGQRLATITLLDTDVDVCDRSDRVATAEKGEGSIGDILVCAVFCVVSPVS